MPDSDWPPLPRRLGRAARAAGFTMTAVIGVILLAWPPTGMVASLGPARTVLMGVLGIVGGLLAAVGVLRHHWPAEWVGSWWASAALGGYAAVAWGLLPSYPSPLLIISAAALTGGATLALARAVDLWGFSLQARRGKDMLARAGGAAEHRA